MKTLILCLLFLGTALYAGEGEPDDWSYSNHSYAVNISFPFDVATLIGPDFVEGTHILKTYVQGRLESDSSFHQKLIRIVDALASSEEVSTQQIKRKKKHVK